jgi:diguanylate cyclase (GGDEF)-like protein
VVTGERATGEIILDTVTLRVSFGILALTMLLLFYLVTFRSTRSPFCGWWCIALSLFLGGSAAYLLDGTPQQWWSNPLGNSLLVGGATSVWSGARTIRGRRLHGSVFAGTMLATAAASAVDDPATNVWSGAPVFLGLMAILIGLTSAELWTAVPSGSRLRFRELAYAPILRSLATLAAVMAVFYAGRLVAFLAVGQDGRLFAVFFGSELTTVLMIILLATVSFSMAALSHVDDTVDLRARATHDGLTGLLNRTEFMRLAAARWRSQRRHEAHGSLILADLDHFKRINDRYGHAAGDYALQTFAAACRGVVRSTDLVGRYGGEEFIVFLGGAPPDQARQVAQQISERLRSTPSPEGMSLPTVSYGVAFAEAGAGLTETIALADRALYEAKSAGRDRTVLGTADAQDAERS